MEKSIQNMLRQRLKMQVACSFVDGLLMERMMFVDIIDFKLTFDYLHIRLQVATCLMHHHVKVNGVQYKVTVSCRLSRIRFD